MLAICDNIDMLQKCHEFRYDQDQLAEYLSCWMEETLGMTAMCDPDLLCEVKECKDLEHPSTIRFVDVNSNDSKRDITSCQVKFQTHKCSAYCMRKRKYTSQDESPESKQCRVCQCGAGQII